MSQCEHEWTPLADDQPLDFCFNCWRNKLQVEIDILKEENEKLKAINIEYRDSLQAIIDSKCIRIDHAYCLSWITWAQGLAKFMLDKHRG